ncbi:class I SAM-dependent methyltransferase [Nocardia sp. NPDC050712]|uniref:class I SAM-dependent methyltransferase n=1 Tax=Nocardia sp. NPDC050712 TaxID=3155518 RepID=UPI0034067C74
MLAVYDWLVLGLVCRWIWRCPRSTMLAHYNAQVGAHHLDLGPGTGWFLDNCRFPTPAPSITLVDLSDVALATAAKRIARYRPATRGADVFKPLNLGATQFDSVGLNLLLHCLPGSFQQKAVVFDHVTPYLGANGRVFGSTILGIDKRHTVISSALVRRLNGSDSFDNAADRVEDLARELEARFTEVRIARAGVICLFSARHPRPAAPAQGGPGTLR